MGRILSRRPSNALLTCLLATALSTGAASCRLRRVGDEEPDGGASPLASAEPAASALAPEVPSAPAPVEEVVVPEPIPEGAAVLAAAAAPPTDRTMELLSLALGRVGGERLDEGRELDAVATALAFLEQTGELPAGMGAPPRHEGGWISRDAAMMTYASRFGAVVATGRLAQPSLLSELVASSPPRVLAGEGAHRFAAARGVLLLADSPRPSDASSRERPPWEELTDAGVPSGDAGVADAGPSAVPEDLLDGGAPPELVEDGGASSGGPDDSAVVAGEEPAARLDGIAVVLRAGPGRFACGFSAGGLPSWAPGRITSAGTVGAHLYATKSGAVAILGAEDLLATRPLAREVHDRMLVTRNPDEAVRWGLGEVDPADVVMILAVDPRRTAVASRPEQAWLERNDREDASEPPTAALPPTRPPATPPPPARPPEAPRPAPPPAPAAPTSSGPESGP